MNQYAKGRRAEYYWKKYLQEQGAKYIVRSAGSKGLTDLIAFFPSRKEIWLIQVKSSKKRVNLDSLKEMYKELTELKGNYNVKSYLFISHKHGKAILQL